MTDNCRFTDGLGRHLLCLNVFRESDGSVQITTSGHSKLFMSEYTEWSLKHPEDKRPIDYGDRLIVEAAGNIAERVQGKHKRFYAKESARGLAIFHDPGPNSMKYPVLFVDPEMPQSQEVMEHVAEILNRYYQST